MTPLNKNIQVFLSLVRAGLWEHDVQLASFGKIDFNDVYRLAAEQSVVGLVAAGIEHIIDVKVPQEVALTFAGSALQLEQQNKAMNQFIGVLIEKLRAADIYALLVKGQGIAQCYERPLWRSCGDIDFFLSPDNYNKAIEYLSPLASSVGVFEVYKCHLPLTIDNWEVELHGSLRSGLWAKLDKVIDEVQSDVFYGGNVRSWINDYTQVFLPRADEDIIFVFSHILQHFFKEGVGLRQICDWCRLLWTNHDVLNVAMLESRLKRSGIMTEWKCLSALAVKYLGMPSDVLPFYSSNRKWLNKASRIMDSVLETGNFGHNREKEYYSKHSFVVYKMISLGRYSKDIIHHFSIFPKDSIKTWCSIVRTGIRAAIQQIKPSRFNDSRRTLVDSIQ